MEGAEGYEGVECGIQLLWVLAVAADVPPDALPGAVDLGCGEVGHRLSLRSPTGEVSSNVNVVLAREWMEALLGSR